MVDVVGRAKVIVESQINKASFDQDGNKIGGALKKGALVGVAALAGLATAGVKASIAFGEAEAVQRKLNNTLANMGKSGASEAVNQLADDLMRVTGIDDEVIRGGQTVLATFSEIAESAGVQGGAFERATKAALDLSTVFGGVQQSSVQVGKALQDPIKGVTALGRAGVTFTEEQKALIKSLVDTGDTLGAQDIILKEIEKQVGGNAEASATAADKIKNAFGELEEAFGNLLSELTGGDVENLADGIQALADAVDRFAEGETVDNLAAAIDQLQRLGESEWAENFEEDQQASMESFKQWAKDFDAEMTASREGWIDFGVKFRDTWNGMLDITRSAGDDIKETAKDIWDDFVADVRNVPTRLRELGGKFKDAGRNLIREFVAGIGANITSSFGPQLSSAIKGAINKSLGLPRKITLGDGTGGLIPDFTVTIPALASGARNFGGGLALVGEQGPELVSLPRGSDVYTASETRNMGGGINVTQIFNGPNAGSEAARAVDFSLKYGTRFGAATAAGGF
jgi:hypothetical protein